MDPVFAYDPTSHPDDDLPVLFSPNPQSLEVELDDLEQVDAHLRNVLGFTFGKVDFRSRERAASGPHIWALVHGWVSRPILISVFTYHAEADPRVHTVNEHRVQHWSEILCKHPFPFADKVELKLTMRYLDGIAERRKRADDWVYVQEHYQDYYVDFVRGFDMEEQTSDISDIIEFMQIPPTSEEQWRNKLPFWLRAVG